MAVKIKCIYEEPNRADGLRVLVTNYWPRGIRKDRISRWERELGTSPDLIKKWKSGSINWATFSRLFLKTVKSQKDKIMELASLAGKQDITLLCTCHDGNRCHRKLLKELIEKQTGRTK
jgi:uncharacterized protein YeaO (DUF488 family)